MLATPAEVSDGIVFWLKLPRVRKGAGEGRRFGERKKEISSASEVVGDGDRRRTRVSWVTMATKESTKLLNKLRIIWTFERMNAQEERKERNGCN